MVGGDGREGTGAGTLYAGWSSGEVVDAVGDGDGDMSWTGRRLKPDMEDGEERAEGLIWRRAGLISDLA